MTGLHCSLWCSFLIIWHFRWWSLIVCWLLSHASIGYHRRRERSLLVAIWCNCRWCHRFSLMLLIATLAKGNDRRPCSSIYCCQVVASWIITLLLKHDLIVVGWKRIFATWLGYWCVPGIWLWWWMLKPVIANLVVLLLHVVWVQMNRWRARLLLLIMPEGWRTSRGITMVWAIVIATCVAIVKRLY